MRPGVTRKSHPQMKIPLLLPLLSVAVLVMGTPLPPRRRTMLSAETTAAPGSTVITSDELHSDQGQPRFGLYRLT